MGLLILTVMYSTLLNYTMLSKALRNSIFNLLCCYKVVLGSSSLVTTSLQPVVCKVVHNHGCYDVCLYMCLFPDMFKGVVGDMSRLGVTKSFLVKHQMLLLASKAAEMILRVDNIIKDQQKNSKFQIMII